MTIVDILMVVDVEGALATKNLRNNIYLIDTHKNFGSTNEGQAELCTMLNPGDIVRWTVVPVQQDGEVSIHSFSGQAVDQHIIKPQQDPTTGSWSARFNTFAGSGTRYQYTSTLLFEGRTTLTFAPFLKVK